jgi:hypothetical protein
MIGRSNEGGRESPFARSVTLEACPAISRPDRITEGGAVSHNLSHRWTIASFSLDKTSPFLTVAQRETAKLRDFELVTSRRKDPKTPEIQKQKADSKDRISVFSVPIAIRRWKMFNELLCPRSSHGHKAHALYVSFQSSFMFHASQNVLPNSVQSQRPKY